jgi:hypothetical protein
MWDDYRFPPGARMAKRPTPAEKPARLVGWHDLLIRWDDVMRDVADLYGIDLTDPEVLDRPWPLIRPFIWGLPRENPAESRVAASLAKEVRP